jgi:hypothetical protein
MARTPPHPNSPGKRVWTRDASGTMRPDLSKASPRVAALPELRGRDLVCWCAPLPLPR